MDFSDLAMVAIALNEGKKKEKGKNMVSINVVRQANGKRIPHTVIICLTIKVNSFNTSTLDMLVKKLKMKYGQET